jgi:hypothetical protein
LQTLIFLSEVMVFISLCFLGEADTRFPKTSCGEPGADWIGRPERSTRPLTILQC